MADILDKRPVDAEMTVFKTEIDPNKLNACIDDILMRLSRLEDVQPVKRGHWIEKSEEYYRLWQDSGRSWDDMPYFVTGLKFACSNCFEQFDVNANGVEKWNGCPICLAKMGGDK